VNLSASIYLVSSQDVLLDAIQFKSRTSYIPCLFRLKKQTDQLIKSAVNHQAFL